MNGEHSAQCEAYQRSWRLIYPALYSVLRNRQEAEDILQESILKGFSKLSELKDPERYLGWQKQISLRMALNALRQRKGTYLEFNDPEIADEEEDHTILTEYEVANLHQELENMPEGYRLVIRLHLMEELQHDEIGEMLGITASTSRSQYSRALMRLKKQVKEKHAKQI